MIRHSVHTGLGRGRPELSRLSEGISSSLRQFSIAQARCAADDGKPSSNRQRSAAAASELLSMNEKKPRSRSPSNTQKSSSPGPTAASTRTPTPQIPKVINVSSLRGGSGGGFTGIRKFVPNEDQPGPSSGPSAARGGIISGGIIRGGFRGRGGGTSFKAREGGSSAGRGGSSFAGRGGSSFAGRGGSSSAGRGGGSSAGRGGSSFGSRGGGSFRGTSRGGRGRGRGGRGGSDDRPVRRSKPTKEQTREEEDYQRFISTGKDVDPDVTAYRQAIETGVARSYNPSAPKDLLAELAGYAPAIAANSALARGSVAITQATVLSGGRAYHPDTVPSPQDAKELYKNTHGVFFPSAEARAFVNKTTKKLTYQNPPGETQTAILDAALLGKYDGPKFAEPNDTIGTIRSYVKRHGTWNAAAERSIEAQVKTLLPAAAAAAKGRPAKAQAKKA